MDPQHYFIKRLCSILKIFKNIFEGPICGRKLQSATDMGSVQYEYDKGNSLLASCSLSHLLMSFENSLEPGPDLDPNHLALC